MAKKILIVEDEETILELISTILGFENYKLLRARDGEMALKIAREDNPDIILLDIQIPKINGFEVCRSVRSDPAISHTKVLMITGMVQTFDLQKAQEAGADGYITKPFSSTALVEKVKELLRNTQGG